MADTAPIKISAHTIEEGEASKSFEKGENNKVGNEDEDEDEEKVGVLDNHGDLDMIPHKKAHKEGTLGSNMSHAKMGDEQQKEALKNIKKTPDIACDIDGKAQQVFTMFPKLPTEMREKVWKEASYEHRQLTISGAYLNGPPNFYVHPAIIGLFDAARIENHSVPAILHTNHEGRQIGLKSYKIIFGNPATKQEAYINFACDTLVTCHDRFLWLLIKNQRSAERQKARAPGLLEESIKFMEKSFENKRA